MDLSSLLTELMDQQERRKRDLVNSLQHMESEQQVKQQDFWLLQYQKLLDVRDADDASASALDPQLGYQLLTHGVIHLLPFLARLLRTAKCDGDLRAIDEARLKEAGIRSAADRRSILQAIEMYCAAAATVLSECHAISEDEPSAPLSVSCSDAVNDEETNIADREPNGETKEPEPSSHTIEGLAECVVCMEKPVRVAETFFAHLDIFDKNAFILSICRVKPFFCRVVICAAA